MEKKTIKLFFVDFWNGFNPADNFFINRIRLYYDVVLDEKQPDYLFFSWNGHKHQKYGNVIKIYFTGENDVPDFNLCDYALGFHPIQFGDRYLRFPLYVIYDCFGRLESAQITDKQQLLNRGFCSFVVSNAKAADPIRDYFFNELSKYKHVDSGGRHLNNIGTPVKDKYEFIRAYKFNLAFENSVAPGYTTEKLVEPLSENTVPVYWGNPEVEKDFNKDAFIHVNDFESADAAIKEIIRLDNDDEAYLQMLSAPHFIAGQKTQKEWLHAFDAFVGNIFNKEPEHAKRITTYGFSRFYRNKKFILTKLGAIPGIEYIIRKLAYNK